MKTIFLTIVTALSFCAIKAQDSSRILYEGTIVTVKIMQDISSKSADVGDILNFETTEPIIVADSVMVPVGCKVSGKVTNSEKAKGLGKAGKLDFSVDYLYLPSGKVIKLTSDQGETGKKKLGAAVAQAVILTPLFLLKKGKQAKFKKGDLFKVFVEKDYSL